MPKPGYVSVTVSEAAYADIEATFGRNRRILRQQGVTNLSGFIMLLLNFPLIDPKALRLLQRRYGIVP